MTRILLGVVAAVMAAMSVAAQPKIEVIGGKTYDWGKIKAPKEGFVEAEIKMRNVGTDVLMLTEIKPGCGCTKTDPDKTELKANEVSTMKVRLNISPSQAGPLTKGITIRSNSADADSVLYVSLKVDVMRALQISPAPFLSFIDMQPGVESTARVELINNDPADIELSDFKTDNNLVLNVTGKKTLKPGERFELIARAVPEKTGSYAAKVTFKTSHPDHESIDISAYGMVMEPKSPVFQKNTAK